MTRQHIDKVAVRKLITPRHEPYWGAPLGRGRVLGFRKITAQTGAWIARMRNENGRKRYKALGDAMGTAGTLVLDYEEARAQALKWFAGQDAGIEDDNATVTDACKSYLAELRAAKRDNAAHDAERRFERAVYGREKGSRKSVVRENQIANVLLSKLTVTQLKEWRNGLPLANLSTSNRTLTALKAALNLAVKNNPALLATKGLEWSTVTPHEIKEDTRRKLVLDLKQRRALVAAAKGPVRDLIQATGLTGSRAGELVNATVSQFNPRAREMTLTGKTGTRTVKLSSAAIHLFKRLAKGKAPDDRLLTREDGRPWGHSDWDELVKDAAKAAKLSPKTCLYSLRHTWISEQIAGGMTTLDVARLAGTSLVMIERHYGKTSKDVQQRLNKVVML